MKARDIRIGMCYKVRLHGVYTVVRLERECGYGGGWYATNLHTGREVRIKSAAKLREEVHPKLVTNAAVPDMDTPRRNSETDFILTHQCDTCGKKHVCRDDRHPECQPVCPYCKTAGRP